MYLKYLLIPLFLLPISVNSQVKKNSSKASSKEAILDLKDVMSNESTDAEVAESYIKLAKGLVQEGVYDKAEENYNKARKLYEKLKNKEKIAEIDRELGKLQEAQNNISKAILNYQSAGSLSKNKIQQSINANDVSRLQTKNLEVQSKYLTSNIAILDKEDDSEAKVQTYQQLANVNLKLNKQDEAIENLNQAKKAAPESEAKIQISKDIAKVYTETQDYEKATETSLEIIEEAKETKNVKEQIGQMQALSSLYFDKNQNKEGLEVLVQAYKLAIEEGRTIDAKNSLLLLTERYQEENKSKEALSVYTDFIKQLEGLIKQDSSLIDSKVYQMNEGKISQLEKERELKDKLIERTSTINYVLTGSIILAAIFLALIARALYSIKKKNKRIALQSLRREMNPHFIFNSLNSVNQFIAQNNELEANKYLSSYSKLMRNIMENSNKDFVSLASELEQLKEYLDLEYMRFSDKFEYKIDINKAIDTDTIFIPNMLIQPQLENAIWHGLRYKQTKGLLTLQVEQVANSVVIKVIDDGIGLAKSLELKTKHQRNHQSRGMNNTLERISLLNDLYKSNITIDIFDIPMPNTGVMVTLKFPILRR